MALQTKYLEELINAIQSAKALSTSNGYLNEFPPKSPLEGDPKSVKVVKTLVKKLLETDTSEEVFGKACQAMNFLLESKPYLLTILIDGHQTSQPGIIWILENFRQISCVHFYKVQYVLYLRRMVARWCQMCVDFYGLTWRDIITSKIFQDLRGLEEQVLQVVNGKMEISAYLSCLRNICVLLEYLLASEFNFLTSLFSNTNGTNWYVQRLIRVLIYTFDSVQLLMSEYEQIQVRILGAVVNESVMRGNRCLATFKFSLELLQTFVKSGYIKSEYTYWSKLLLRLYSQSLHDGYCLQYMKDNLCVDDYDCIDMRVLSNVMVKSILLVKYDLKRRYSAKDALYWDQNLKLWLLDSCQNSDSVILEPFTNSRQLERLRKLILYEFDNPQRSLRAGQIKFLNVDIEDDKAAVFARLEEKISTAIKDSDASQLVTCLKIIKTLSCIEAANAGMGFHCGLCERTDVQISNAVINPSRPDVSKSLAFTLLTKYYLPNYNPQSSGTSLTIGILLALQSVFTHFQPPKLLESDAMGITDASGCMHLFQSSFINVNRSIRMLSIRLIPLWNITALHNSDDQQTALFIKLLQADYQPYTTETNLMGWTQLALSTTGELFDFLLLKLIDIFNSSNFVEHTLMASQLRFIARTLNKTPYQLLSPILPILLKQLGKNLFEKKLSLERLLILVEYPGKTVLENFQTYIVPYAITQYKGDVLTEIAKIMCDNDTTLIVEQKKRLLDRNSRQIFAAVLVKHGLFSLETIETLFINHDPTFNKNLVAGYLPDYKTLAEVLKLYNATETLEEAVSENEKSVLSSLRFLFLTNFAIDRHRGTKFKNIKDWSDDKEVIFQKKLKDNILGIFQVFSSDMHDIEGRTTYYEKLRVISGISFLIKYASKESIISALAQVSICLQTGLEIPEIRYNTMKCWGQLVKCLSEEQIITVSDVLLCYILQTYDKFNDKVKQAALEVLDIFLLEKQKLITTSRPYIILALLNKPELSLFEKHGTLARIATKVVNTTNWVSVFVENLKSYNVYVIKQTLLDIKLFFQSKGNSTLDFNMVSKSSTVIVTLLGSLLDTSHKFRNTDIEICQACALCISMIGVLDVTKYEFKRDAINDNDVCDFSNQIQTTKFLINIINDRLVPAFWQSENPTKQLFVALVIQESLKYCGLSSSSWDVTKPDLYPNQAKLWDRFNEISKTTLYPLLSSLYLAQSWKEYVPLKYPSFNVKDGYSSWIKNLTLDLLKTATSSSHPLHVFSSLIREDDGTLSDYLLCYIVMDMVIKADDEIYSSSLDNIITEFEYIFNYTLYDLNHFQIDALKMAYDSIFRVFEYCKKWVNQFKQNYCRQHGSYIIREEKHLRMLKRAEKLVNVIPSHLLAQRSLETNSFERSALYLEQSYREQTQDESNAEKLLSYLKTTYAEIGDIDSVVGVLKVFSTDSLTSKIEELQYSDNWKMAQDCFEALGEITIDDVKGLEDKSEATMKMLRSMYDHQLYDQTLQKLDLLMPHSTSKLNSKLDDIYNMGAETAALSGNMATLKKLVHKIEQLEELSDPSILLHYNLAKLLLAVANKNSDGIQMYANYCYRLIGSHFTTPSHSTTLLKGRNILMKLHAIRDIILLSSSKSENQYLQSVRNLDLRLRNVGSDFEPNYYILSLRKSYGLLQCDDGRKSDLAESYLRMSQIARTNDRVDIASDCLMHALSLGHPSAELEYAEILWKQGENELALKTVAEIHRKSKNSKAFGNRDRAKVLLKYTGWLDLSNNATSVQVSQQFKEVINIDKEWDEPYYSFGLYYSRLLEKKKADGYITNGSLEYKAVTYFLISFEKNSAKVREALPKVITFWLDTASLAVTSPSQDNYKRYAKEICKCVDVAVQRCPTHIWYSVLTQLLSRLLHNHTESATLMITILMKLTMEYPSIMLWYMVALLNSQESKRVNCGQHIIGSVKKHIPETIQLISSATLLVQALTKVCLKEVKGVSSRSGRLLKNDFKFDMTLAPSDLVVPVNINLTLLVPNTSKEQRTSNKTSVTISCFTPQYKVFSSLKKPKKINIIGSDGNVYGIMCKKEDVRQDNQYMQFANTMGFLLEKDPHSRKRNLNITTYAVLSLREDCGLIEIVPNVDTIRSILMAKYDSMKVKYSLSALYEKWKALSEDQRLGFYKNSMSTFSPVLYQWFLEIFPNPILWYSARNFFVRSYAVMAMVGHILGLGDRHLENILLDLQTGKVLHVDFDCIFEKGKCLPVPEIVPFRLTQNIVDAFGVTGTEGTFKKSSEVTVRVMRNNEIALVNIIETIMYDRNMDHSIQNALKVLRNKIRGIDPRDNLALSVPGQVETVVQQATSEENLSQMYIGWLPFW
ncbi:HBL098Wp [Eremothecium sinecaudum]|uniref:Serine/threonine-protein kinase MEC1 n=1 Tax=Eremothecium sinecaudum TaxID=45286 RepID=A0A109UWH6_9SACH|nr:HBL098Wp [Eremothecium sinecaudum]AMD18804.1 HBL098Wp [Eremothecium sinecaudum]